MRGRKKMGKKSAVMGAKKKKGIMADAKATKKRKTGYETKNKRLMQAAKRRMTPRKKM